LALTWRQAERLVARLLGADIVTDRTKQVERDIDLERDGTTISVKYQPAVARYGNVAFETELEDAAGARMPGNWARCDADEYVLVVPRADYAEVIRWHTDALARVVDDPEAKWRLAPLTAAQAANNASMGRTFTKSYCLLVPLDRLIPLADFRKGIPYEELVSQ
jgi:hypothetical protein